MLTVYPHTGEINDARINAVAMILEEVKCTIERLTCAPNSNWPFYCCGARVGDRERQACDAITARTLINMLAQEELWPLPRPKDVHQSARDLVKKIKSLAAYGDGEIYLHNTALADGLHESCHTLKDMSRGVTSALNKLYFTVTITC